MSKRSERRHHRERLKKNRKGYWGGSIDDDRKLGIVSNTPKVNQCLCCCNPRRAWGEKTIQERKAEEEYG